MVYAGLFRNASFVRFFLGAGISTIGNWFDTVAASVLIFRLTGQVSSVAVSIAVLALPRMFLAPLGGAIADRFERRRLLVTVDALRSGVALLPLLVHTGSLVWLIYVSLLALQVGSSVYYPAQSSYLPDIVPDHLLEAANSANSTMRDVGVFLGPALASLILASWGTSAAFGGNALSFAFSAALLLTLPRSERGPVRDLNPRALFAGYLATIGHYRSMAALALCYLGAAMPIFYFQGTMVAYTRELGQPTSFVGVIYAAAGIGGVVAGVTMGQYLPRLSFIRATTIFLVSVPALGVLPFVHDATPALFIVAASTLAGTSGHLAFIVRVQRTVPSSDRGHAFGLLSWCDGIGQFVGAGIVALVATGMAVSMLSWISIAALPVALTGAVVSLAAPHPALLPTVETASERV